MMQRTRMLLIVAAATTALGGGVAWATSGAGVVPVTMARGTVSPQLKLKLHDSSQPSDVVVQQVTFAPGGFSGWHTHPGPAIVIIKSGQITVYDAPSHNADNDDEGDSRDGHAVSHHSRHASCTGTTYTAGEVFIDQGYGHVHIARNEGSTPAELWITFLDVPPGASPRIDAASPGNCPF